jgi:hypothetical protein
MKVLLRAARGRSDGRIPPYLFTEHRSVDALLRLGAIEFDEGWGAPMYKFTSMGAALVNKEIDREEKGRLSKIRTLRAPVLQEGAR